MSAWILDLTTSIMALALLVGTVFLGRLILRVEKTTRVLEEMARTLTQEATSTLQNVNAAAEELRQLGTEARTDLGRLEKIVRGIETMFDSLSFLASLAKKQSGPLVRVAGVIAGVNQGIAAWRRLRPNKVTARGENT